MSMRTCLRALQLILTSLWLFGAIPAVAQDEETMDWLDDYQKALQEAKRTHKPIFLEFRCEA
jgi:hypothetical protein